MKIKLLFPPKWSLHYPYLSLPTLTGYLQENDVEVDQIDLNILLYDMILSKNGMTQIVNKINDMNIQKTLKERQGFDNVDYLINNIDKFKKVIRRYESPKENIELKRLAGKALFNAINLINLCSFPFPSFSELNIKNILKIIEKDDVFSELFEKYFILKILRGDPELIGISICGNSQFLSGLKIANLIKKESPETYVVIGGPMTTYIIKCIYDYQKLFSFFDGIILGDGEKALLRLVEGVSKSKFDDIPNLVYIDKNRKIRKNLIINEDLNSLPPPSFDGLPLGLYFNPSTLPIQTSRGCYWAKCTFCNYKSVIGCERYREKCIPKVVDEIRCLIDKYDMKKISIEDDCIYPSRMNQLANEIIKNKLNISWYAYVRPEKGFTSIILSKMARSGCKELYFGIESGCQRILDLMKKGTEIKTMGDVLKKAKENGISNTIFIIVGFPTETFDEINETIKFVSNNAEYIDIVDVYKFRMMWESEIEKNKEKYFIYKDRKNNIAKKELTQDEINYICRNFHTMLPSNTKNKLYIKYFLG